MKVERTLLIHGLTLFLVGLIAGLAVSEAANPRAGLAAHLEGVMNGTFLLVIALVSPHLALGARTAAIARWLLVAGAWLNIVGTGISAMYATNRITPLAGAGFGGPEWAEGLVALLLTLTVPTMIPAVGILLWGAVRAPAGE